MSLIDDSQDDQNYTEEEFTAAIEQYTTYAEEEMAPVAVHQCNVCNKIFMSFKGLQQHAVIHTDTKPYICDVCGRGFRFKSNMFEHRTVHTGFTPHLCPFCGKQFRLKGNMKKHMRVHVTTKEELEAAFRPYSSNRRSSAIVPDNALVIRGSPLPFFNTDRRRSAQKLQLGADASKWVRMICQNELLPTSPFNDKVVQSNMRLMGSQNLRSLLQSAKALEFEIYWCPLCKMECAGKGECELHLYVSHGKKLQDMQREPNYCSKCMRVFSNEGMYLQHQSYHSRVQLMVRNREIDSGSPEIGFAEICYNMLSNRMNAVKPEMSSENAPSASTSTNQNFSCYSNSESSYRNMPKRVSVSD